MRFSYKLKDFIYWIEFINTRETPAFGGISLALQGSGAFGGDERRKKEKKLGRQKKKLGESGFYNERTDRITPTSSTVL